MYQVYGHVTAHAPFGRTAWNTHPSEIPVCVSWLSSNLCSNVTFSMKHFQTLFKTAHPTSYPPSFFSFLMVLYHYLNICADMQIHTDCLYTCICIYMHTCTLLLIVCLWSQDSKFLRERDSCLFWFTVDFVHQNHVWHTVSTLLIFAESLHKFLVVNIIYFKRKLWHIYFLAFP